MKTGLDMGKSSLSMFDSRSSWGSDLLFNHYNLIPFYCSFVVATTVVVVALSSLVVDRICKGIAAHWKDFLDVR